MEVLSSIEEQHDSVSALQYDVVIVGAGPYGLSTAAYVLEKGLRVGIFGKPINLRRKHMPEGMLLCSYWWATSISDPHGQYSLEQYFREKGQEPIDPLPVQTFIEYGLWFQKLAVPNVDETYVETIESEEGRFVVTLVDGRVIQSSAVVMAPGLKYYVYCPAEYESLSAGLVSHTSDHHTFGQLAGKRLVIIGGGQSALETAALACESGADVQLVTCSPLAWIRGSGSFPEHRPLLQRLRSPKAGIAAGWFNWGLEHFPYLFQQLPRSTKERCMSGPGRYGPIGAAWLKPRIEGKVLLHEMQRVEEVEEVVDGVMLILSNSKKLKANHIILGTGYRVDVSKLPMLHPRLLSQLRTYRNTPVLNNQFESNVSGLYFVGFSAISSCGPLYRFVVGTKAAAQRVVSSVTRQTRLWEEIYG
jgi:hypothetical protein